MYVCILVIIPCDCILCLLSMCSLKNTQSYLCTEVVLKVLRQVPLSSEERLVLAGESAFLVRVLPHLWNSLPRETCLAPTSYSSLQVQGEGFFIIPVLLEVVFSALANFICYYCFCLDCVHKKVVQKCFVFKYKHFSTDWGNVSLVEIGILLLCSDVAVMRGSILYCT